MWRGVIYRAFKRAAPRPRKRMRRQKNAAAPEGCGSVAIRKIESYLIPLM
jgi:hypothetical protein